MSRTPFFVRFVESRPTPSLDTGVCAGFFGGPGWVKKGGIPIPPVTTMKYPSDSDEDPTRL